MNVWRSKSLWPAFAPDMLNIVLYEPEIPYNTGNIGRTCVATNSKLHLIKPLGFSLDQKEIKRAGLDYWPKLNLSVYENYEDFLVKNNLFFVKGLKSEDIEWALRVYEYTPSWAFYAENIFVTRRGREGSITSTVSYEHLTDYLKIVMFVGFI